MNITPLFPDRATPPAGASVYPVLEILSEAAALALQARHRGRSSDEATSGIAVTLLEGIRAHGTATVPHLAREGATSRQNIQVQVNRLLRLGCVELVPNPAHRRSPLVRLTAQGEQLLEGYRAAQEQQYQRLAGELNPSDLAVTVAVLRKLRAAMNPVATRRPKRTRPKIVKAPAMTLLERT
jgi:DNA-binding MarR family transcriptional regulator